MDKPPFLLASLPLPPSVNNMYVNVLGRGRIMSAAARDYKEMLLDVLYHGRIDANYYIYEDVAQIQEIREHVLLNEGKCRKQFAFKCLYVFKKNSTSDIDSRHKFLQDRIMGDWLEINDRSVCSIELHRIYDTISVPHVEIVVCERTTSHYSSGGLLNQVKISLGFSIELQDKQSMSFEQPQLWSTYGNTCNDEDTASSTVPIARRNGTSISLNY